MTLHYWLTWLAAFLIVLAALSVIAGVRAFLDWKRENDQR